MRLVWAGRVEEGLLPHKLVQSPSKNVMIMCETPFQTQTSFLSESAEWWAQRRWSGRCRWCTAARLRRKCAVMVGVLFTLLPSVTERLSSSVADPSCKKCFDSNWITTDSRARRLGFRRTSWSTYLVPTTSANFPLASSLFGHHRRQMLVNECWEPCCCDCCCCPCSLGLVMSGERRGGPMDQRLTLFLFFECCFWVLNGVVFCFRISCEYPELVVSLSLSLLPCGFVSVTICYLNSSQYLFFLRHNQAVSEILCIEVLVSTSPYWIWTDAFSNS